MKKQWPISNALIHLRTFVSVYYHLPKLKLEEAIRPLRKNLRGKNSKLSSIIVEMERERV